MCVGGTDRETDHGLRDPSLILSFSSIHDRFPLKGKKKSLGRNMPKEALRLSIPHSKKRSKKGSFNLDPGIVFCAFISVDIRPTLLP